MSFSAEITHIAKITETGADSMTNSDSNNRHRQALLQAAGPRKITNGSNDNQATQSFVDSLACVSGVAQNFDLSAMADPLMGTLNFGKVNYIELRPNSDVSAASMVFEGGAANPWEGSGYPLGGTGYKATCGAGGRLLFESWVDGFAVDGTHKTFKITPAFTGSFTLIIIGD